MIDKRWMVLPTKRKYVTVPCIAALFVISISRVNAAQINTEQGPTTENTLKVLSNDLSEKELRAIMRTYVRETGFTCEGCHAKYPNSEKLNYASDENPIKEEARLMIRMTNEIQKKYMQELGSGPNAPKVSCGTCHRGLPEPEAFEAKK